MKTRGEIQQFTNLIYNTQFQKVNVLSILKDISMNILKFWMEIILKLEIFICFHNIK